MAIPCVVPGRSEVITDRAEMARRARAIGLKKSGESSSNCAPDSPARQVSPRAETIESAVLTTLRDYMADERNRRSMQMTLARRTQKAQANIASLEKRLGDLRAKIERGTENLALANREDVPGISRLLG